MLAVGIRELKAKLSQYVRLAAAGETVLVTDHNQVVAELRPSRRQELPAGSLEDVLEELAASGEVTRASRTREERLTKIEGLGMADGTALRILDELRGDH